MAHFLRDWEAKSKENRRGVAEEKLILAVTERICEELERRNMTRADLAESMGKSKPLVSQLLDGKRNMTLRTLADIAFSLGLEPSFSAAS